VPENVGAGEGNRTLVFSLEGFRRLNTFNVNSDKENYFRSLITKAFFALSEQAVSLPAPGNRSPPHAQSNVRSGCVIADGMYIAAFVRWWRYAKTLRATRGRFRRHC